MLIGFVIVTIIILTAIPAPVITFHSPTKTAIFERLEGPSLRHWFGTDHLGVDVYARTIYGSQVSLLVGMLVATLVIGGGLFFGLIAGYNRALDGPIMRVADAIMAFSDAAVRPGHHLRAGRQHQERHNGACGPRARRGWPGWSGGRC